MSVRVLLRARRAISRGPAHCGRCDGIVPLREWLAVLLVALTSLACGARTGLLVPCRIPLRASPATLVFVIDASGSMAYPASGDAGPSVYAVLVEHIAAFAESLPPTAAVGALVYSRNRSYEPVSEQCLVPDRLDVPIAPNNARRLSAFLRGVAPDGLNPTAPAIRSAAMLLRANAWSDSRTIVVFGDGGAECGRGYDASTCYCAQHAPEWCLSLTPGGAACFDYIGVLRETQLLREANVRTAFVVVGALDPANSIAQRYDLEITRWAEAGGLPNLLGPHRFYQADDATRAYDPIAQAVGVAVYCDLQVAAADGGVLRDDLEMQTQAGERVAYDLSGEDGWRWADASRSRIEVRGRACARVAASRAVPFLVTRGRACHVP